MVKAPPLPPGLTPTSKNLSAPGKALTPKSSNTLKTPPVTATFVFVSALGAGCGCCVPPTAASHNVNCKS